MMNTPSFQPPTSKCRRARFSSSRPIQFVQTRATASLEAPAASSVGAAVKLPESLKNNVAILTANNPAAPGGKTTVYVLGMSHVSQKSCEHVRELVAAVKPEVVAVELCRERLGLLMDPDIRAKDLWHTRKVFLEGVPSDEGWPSPPELKSLLKAKVGRVVSQQDIEDDVRTLLGTGLFRSARPVAEQPSRDEAPEFIVQGGAGQSAQLKGIAPLGSVRYICAERTFPPITTFEARLDSSLKDEAITQEQLNEICTAAVEESKGGASTVLCLLRARAKFIQLSSTPGAVSFSGADSGRLEVVVKAQKPSDPPYLSGLESSAIGGEGWGIDTFRPSRPSYPISEKMNLPAEALERIRASQLAGPSEADAESGTVEGENSSLSHLQPRSVYREWSEEEIANPASPSIPEQPVVDAFSGLLISQYAKLQAEAGSRAGVDPGTAWQVALEAATEAGAQQFLLADRPADITQRKLADNIFSTVGIRLAASVGIFVAAAAAATSSLVPDAAADAGFVFVAVGATVQLLWPVVGPFFEMYSFSKMSAAEIEDTVAMKQPIDQGDLSKPIKIYGEDALLDWPGAIGPVIDERDAFMGKVLAAAACGKGVAPGFVLDSKDGQLVWRYMMPEGAPTNAAPAGRGDGCFQPLPGPSSVVAVVGTAHVHGMVRDWDMYLKDNDVEPLLVV